MLFPNETSFTQKKNFFCVPTTVPEPDLDVGSVVFGLLDPDPNYLYGSIVLVLVKAIVQNLPKIRGYIAAIIKAMISCTLGEKKVKVHLSP